MDDIRPALEALRAGRLILAIDEGKETASGDLVVAAEHADADALHFLVSRAGGGIMYVVLSGERLDALDLPLLARSGEAEGWSGASMSVDAAGLRVPPISMEGRAATIARLMDPATRPDGLVRPGHVHPLRPRAGGVLKRAGHTEAALDLVRLAGLQPGAVICTVLGADGSCASLEALGALAEAEGLPVVSVAAVIAHRSHTEKLVRKDAESVVTTEHGTFRFAVYTSLVDGDEYLAAIKGDVAGKPDVLVRVHSGCITGNVFDSLQCDCGWQLRAALRMIEAEGCGVVLYIAGHEGRGMGLPSKIRAYHLQRQGLDTVEANEALGFPADSRDYGCGAQVLRDLGLTTMRLITNNPRKYAALDGHGLQIVERVPVEAPPTEHSERYLATKQAKLGHWLRLEPNALSEATED